MLITQIITYIMAVFAAAGAIDRILGDRSGLGSKFERAFHTMGPLALSMAGMLRFRDAMVRGFIFLPMIVAKLSSGIAAMAVALWMNKGR